LNRKNFFTFLLLVQLSYISFIINVSDSNYASRFPNNQFNEPPLTNLKTAADQLEYNRINGTLSDVTQLEIELPDTTWNITDVKINFTDIKLHRRVRVIEDNLIDSEYKNIYYEAPDTWYDALGVQLRITEPTTIYGVYLYGKRSSEIEDVIFFGIRGFDDSSNIINKSVYYIQNINISETEGWHLQDFSNSPVKLGTDDYYILIDGWFMYQYTSNYSLRYHPSSSSIYRFERIWVWNVWGWWDIYETPYLDGPLLCKVIEKVDRTYYPENIEMKAEINGNQYFINNTINNGEGNLTVTNINFFFEDNELIIPISHNNGSTQLIYNLTYSISLQKPMLIQMVESGGNGKSSTKITGLPLEMFILFIIITIIIIVSSLVSYTTFRKKKIKKENFRKKIFNKYMDVVNLNYVMVTDKLSGLNMYEQMISGKNMNPTLISGFLQAISSFGIELTGSEEQSQTIKLGFQKSKIIMSEFKNYRLINIFEENPSKEFMDSIEPLSQDIDKYYGKMLKNFDGETTRFAGIKELLEKHLQISLIYPLKVVISDNTKLKSEEKTLVYQAINYMKKRNSDYFYISYLMSGGDFNPKRAEKILGLIDRRIFQPIV